MLMFTPTCWEDLTSWIAFDWSQRGISRRFSWISRSRLTVIMNNTWTNLTQWFWPLQTIWGPIVTNKSSRQKVWHHTAGAMEDMHQWWPLERTELECVIEVGRTAWCSWKIDPVCLVIIRANVNWRATQLGLGEQQENVYRYKIRKKLASLSARAVHLSKLLKILLVLL